MCDKIGDLVICTSAKRWAWYNLRAVARSLNDKDIGGRFSKSVHVRMVNSTPPAEELSLMICYSHGLA